MISREIKFIEWFNKETSLNLVKTNSKFSLWDFHNENYIAELKIRNDYYKEKAIQADKCLNMLQNAELLNKKPIYIVADKKATFVFNLSKIKFENRQIVIRKAPATTEFNRTKKINKYFFLLKENEAKIINYKNTKQ